jgi:hypothetical protein
VGRTLQTGVQVRASETERDDLDADRQANVRRPGLQIRLFAAVLRGAGQAHPEDLAGRLAFPGDLLGQGVVERAGALHRAVVDAAPAEPAFVRVQHDGWLVFDAVGDEHVDPADLDTDVASDTRPDLLDRDQFAAAKTASDEILLALVGRSSSPVQCCTAWCEDKLTVA